MHVGLKEGGAGVPDRAMTQASSMCVRRCQGRCREAGTGSRTVLTDVKRVAYAAFDSEGVSGGRTRLTKTVMEGSSHENTCRGGGTGGDRRSRGQAGTGKPRRWQVAGAEGAMGVAVAGRLLAEQGHRTACPWLSTMELQ